MRSYGVVKNNAQEFANERKRPVYIAKAIKKQSYKIIFNRSQLTPRYNIIEVVRPKGLEKQSKSGRVLPILFNTDMVQAILGGRKTVTRRVIRPRYKEDESGFEIMTNMDTGERWAEKVDEEELLFDPPRYISPPYRPGDILYVRETWQYLCKLDGNEQIIEDTGKYYYAATDSLPSGGYVDSRGSTYETVPWKPSIHMPKAAARIWFKVTNVRMERLQDIDGQEVLKEGINSHVHPKADYFSMNQREMFEKLWNSTIKKADLDKYGWDANPWVWVIEFERCEKPEREGQS